METTVNHMTLTEELHRLKYDQDRDSIYKMIVDNKIDLSFHYFYAAKNVSGMDRDILDAAMVSLHRKTSDRPELSDNELLTYKTYRYVQASSRRQ